MTAVPGVTSSRSEWLLSTLDHTRANRGCRVSNPVAPVLAGRSAMGHEDAFPRPSDRSLFSQATFAGAGGNDEDAPIPVVGVAVAWRVRSTGTGPSPSVRTSALRDPEVPKPVPRIHLRQRLNKQNRIDSVGWARLPRWLAVPAVVKAGAGRYLVRYIIGVLYNGSGASCPI